MIHLSQVKEAIEKDKTFSIKFIKSSTGEIIEIKEATCTSTFHKGTANIKIISSGEIRKIKFISIIEYNGKEVCI